MRPVTTAKMAVFLIGVTLLIAFAWWLSPTPATALLAIGLLIATLVIAVQSRPRALPVKAPSVIVEPAPSNARPARPVTAPLPARPPAKLDQWRHMSQLSTMLSGTLDPQQALDLVSRNFAELTNADATAVFMHMDDAARTLALVRSNGFTTALRHDPPYPLGMGRRSASSDWFVVQNGATDPRVGPIRAALLEARFVSWIELPLAIGNGSEHFGALVAYYQQPHSFAAEEIEVQRIFADHAAYAIRNSQMHRRTSLLLDQRVAQLLALAAINQELTSTVDPQKLFVRVLDYALDGTTSVGGALLLRPEAVGDEPTVARVVAQRGQDSRKGTDFLSRSGIARVLKTNEPTIDRSSLPELTVPISRGDEVLGVITLYAVEKEAFSDDDVLFVRYLATQAVIALDNSRLFQHIQDSRNRLQVILDSMHEAVILIDSAGVLQLANRQIDFMFYWPPAQLMGHTVESLLADPALNLAGVLGFEPDALRSLIRQMAEGRWLGGSSRQSYRIDVPMVRFIDRTIVSTHDAGGLVSGMLLVFADATEERELAQAREDLTRMIVHDLRAPLTAVTTSMHLLTDISSEDARLQRALSRTVDASQRALRKLLHLVDSLLDIAKMESGTMTLDRVPHLLGPVAHNVGMELAPLADDLEVNIEIDIADSLGTVDIDAPKIERVLLNLVDNALKFSPIGGQLTIQAQPCADESAFIQLTIADRGPGIPDSYKLRIFDRFEQVSGSQGRRHGTGLGLTFCKLAVEAHGGRIWIEDNPGGGSCFVFTLPTRAKATPVNSSTVLVSVAAETSAASAAPDRLSEQHAD